MRENTPSATAQRVAMRRAVHQIVDTPRVFEDPLAIAIIGESAAAAVRSGTLRFETRGSLRAFVAARSRFAEDELAEAIGRGAKQYVILGAGLDTYAYRHTNESRDLRVFEMDHPATQAWKRERLQEAGIAIPRSVTFVPVDFEKETLAAALARAGCRTDEITFFSWLGVTPYLNLEAAHTTLAAIAAMPAGSGVVFDYAVPRSSLRPLEQLAFDDLAGRVARAGEPFQLFLEPEALEEMLRGLGFSQLEDLGPAEIDARYFQGRSDGLRVAAGLAHLISARV